MPDFAVQISGSREALEGLELILSFEDAARLFPHQIDTLDRLAEEAHARVVRLAAQASQGYAESIRLERLAGPEWRIFADQAAYPRAGAIEYGHPAWDMKRVLRISAKARQGRRGRYLIIPLRRRRLTVATPGAKREWGGVALEEGSFLTFRTMSESSPPDSWIYPDRPGARVAEQVLAWLEGALPSLMDLARERDAQRITLAASQD